MHYPHYLLEDGRLIRKDRAPSKPTRAENFAVFWRVFFMVCLITVPLGVGLGLSGGM